MADDLIVNVSRRRFLKASAVIGTGLVLGACLPSAFKGGGKQAATFSQEAGFVPNAFVRIGTDDRVTVIIKHLEMGQGTYTGLTTLVAEELDADWSQVTPEGAPADASRYNNLLWGPYQGTGGSTAMANSFEQMRKAGAAARQMLVTAAAQRWQVPAGDITVQKGVIAHAASGHKATFGELAAAAAELPVPKNIVLKDPEDFVYIGKYVPRKDDGKTDGSAVFTFDIKLPGMLIAVVAHPPRFGAKVRSFDAGKAQAVDGVVKVVEIPRGVAVLAKDFWSAKQGRDALSVEWDENEAFKLGSTEIMARYKELAQKSGAIARREGDSDQALDQAARVLEAEYEFPYLAHAAMEPLNCVVRIDDDGCEIWNGCQLQTGDQKAVASLLGLEPEQVKIHMLYAGGSFGRRGNPHSDYVVEAASIAREVGKGIPVKMLWTREDDMRAGYFRPMYFHRLRAGLDEQGNPIAWQHRIVGQSIMRGTAFESVNIDENGVDSTSVEGAANLPYAISSLTVDLHSPEIGVPVQWWRSVGSTHTAFATETFIDALAEKAGKDPVAFRLALLKDHPRHRKVLTLAAKKAGWGTPLAEGRGRGVAVHKSFNSYVAQVVEVTVRDDGSFTVDRVVCAVDCGVAVNPDVIRAQMEGGIGYGLSPVLMSEITLEEGRVKQSNFHNYSVLRINQMPAVEVHIVPSAQPPTGVGEPATPVIAPAVANALHAATGRRFYRLPLTLSA
ncbi:xanthine dehydrogenase family protein molybdopterin-binding subunit [Methylohalobius crimeensis]|uniref:xanthine dehydrogenase family protein molybdopterin-binding subunit n=1 Tax=Methylohalobius crimeensis TaxID=244365 RepID=UPI0003B6C290|nr:xanthine dehydrogenase family protein molybdopterin-binding subunit [Methylohalobius crimeensis]